jgi:hypothetical protein
MALMGRPPTSVRQVFKLWVLIGSCGEREMHAGIIFFFHGRHRCRNCLGEQVPRPPLHINRQWGDIKGP